MELQTRIFLKYDGYDGYDGKDGSECAARDYSGEALKLHTGSALLCALLIIRLGFFDFREESFDKRGVWFEFYCVFLAVEIGNIYV